MYQIRTWLCPLLVLWMVFCTGGCATASPQPYSPIEMESQTIESPEASEVPDEKETAEKNQTVFTIETIRNEIVGIDEPVELEDGTSQPLINFDNAATTPALKPVMNEVDQQLKMYGSIGRGFSRKSDYSTDLYNAARETVLDFVGADPTTYTCVYVNNTTDGLNKLASALISDQNDLVLSTRMEHHSNDLSWRERCHVIYAEVDEKGRVDYDAIESMLKENKVKYVAVTAASNVTGYVTDVHRIAKLAHENGARIVVDGAQIVAHRKFSMLGKTPEENIDYFVFSAHKMYSPYGGGAIVGLSEELNQHMPEFYGGGTVKIVSDSWQTYKDAPASYEAGSPNYPGVIGMKKAIEVLQQVGFDHIEAHEKNLNQRLISGILKMDNAIVYGDTENTDDRVGVVSFNFSDVNSFLLATTLSAKGIATRRGAFCAHPYVWRLMGIGEETQESLVDCLDSNTPGMIRVSFGVYNTEEEVDSFLKILEAAHAESVEKMKKTAFNEAY